jgi:tetratricopeptide (TPR) repeat protein
MHSQKAVNYYNQGRKFQQQGSLDEAEKVYRKAIKKQPDFIEAHNNLGNTLVDLHRLKDATKAYRKALLLNPSHAMLLNNLGNAFQLLGENDEAIKWLEKAIDKDPNYADAYNNLGHAFSDLGEIDKAVNAFRHSIQLNPKNELAYRDLAKNRKFSVYDDEIKAMENFHSTPGISTEQKMHLAFALGKVYEDIGEYKKSIEMVIEANRLKRNSMVYSMAEEIEIFSQIKNRFTAEFLAEHNNKGYVDQTPIFVLGMPRSGTSLVEQIIASHPEVYGAGELNDLPELIKKLQHASPKSNYPSCLSEWNTQKYHKTGREYIEAVRKHSDNARYITDKLPHNFMNIGLIKLILPHAKIIHCNRDSMDTCFSIFKNFFSTGHYYSYDMTELGQYYNLYLELMAHWEDVLPGFIYTINYEDLVANQESETSKLLNFCNLPWNDNCLSFHKTKRNVKTASNEQVRRPIYQASVKLWKHYQKQLEPLRKVID